MRKGIYNLFIDDNTTMVAHQRKNLRSLSDKVLSPNLYREKNNIVIVSDSKIFDTSQAYMIKYRVKRFVAYWLKKGFYYFIFVIKCDNIE